MSDRNLRRAWKAQQARKQDVSNAIPALMGNGHGVVEVPNQPGFVYVRMGQRDLGQAFNNRCSLADNLPIFVGYDPILDPDRRIFQVLSVRAADYAAAGFTPNANVGPHHTTHEYGGGDDVYVDWRRLMGLRVGRSTGFTVTVDDGVILRLAQWNYIAAQTLDLTALQPAGLLSCYVLISLDAAGVAKATAGASVGGALDISDCPVPPDGELALAAVRLYGTQTSIGDTPTYPDIVDLRFPFSYQEGTGAGSTTAVLDQIQETINGAYSGGALYGQSFTASISGTLAFVDIYGTRDVGGVFVAPTPAAIEIRNGENIAGALLATGTAVTSLGDGFWYRVTLDANPALTAGNQYCILWDDSGGADTNSWYLDTTGGYAGGKGYNGAWSAAFDFAFKTWMYTTSGTGAAGQVTYWSGTNTITGCTHFLWDNSPAAETLTLIETDNNRTLYVTGSHLYSGSASVMDTAGDRFLLESGSGLGTGVGGNIDFVAGNGGATGAGGSVSFTSGSCTGVGASGDITFTIVPGTPDGNFKFLDPDAAFHGVLDFSNIAASEKTYTFPNVTGTLALGTGAVNTLTYWSATNVLTNLANSGSVSYLRNDGAGGLSWVTTTAATAHDIFSATHSDTTGAASPVDGDTIIGNATPKWSKLAISIPAANVRNVLGIDNGELRPSWKTALDATNPTTIAAGAAASPGTSLIFSHRDHTHGAPATYPATAHNLLDGSVHGDTLADAVTDGDVIIGNATPKWSSLAISIPAAGTLNYLGVNNGELRPSWKSASSNPGAAASILASNTSGYLQVVRLGVGGAPTFYALYVSGQSVFIGSMELYSQYFTQYANAAAIHALWTWSNTTTVYPYFSMYKAKGTQALPSDVVAGDYCGSVNFYGRYGGATGVGVATFSARVDTIDTATLKGILAFSVGDGTSGGANYTAFEASTKGLAIPNGMAFVPSTLLHVLLTDATTNAVVNCVTIGKNVTGAGVGANGLGVGQLFTLETSTTVDTSAALIAASWVDATHASRKAKLVISAYDTAIREAITFEADGAAADTYFSGGAGSGLPYGSCYGNEIAWAQANAVQNQWYLISDADMADGQLNLVTHDGSGKLTVTKAGRYLAVWNASAEVSVAGKHVQMGLSISGASPVVLNHFDLNLASSEIPIGGNEIMSLAAAATVEAAIRTTDAGTPNLAIDHLMISLVQVGG